MRNIRYSEIEELKKELLDLGYYNFQINELVREVVNTTRIDKLPPEKAAHLAWALGQHLEFARKCIVTLEA